MQKQLVVMLCVLASLLLIGCGRTEVDVNRNANAAATSPKPAATPATSTASSTAVGLPECDEFITKYEACVDDKVPEAARAQYKASIEQWRSSWRQLAANPQTKATLADTCKKTIEQARVSMKSFNCNF
ncbi:MAG TPA: hypothetical protein VJM12_18555 [Pyrinomonadaceae bacterium]|nr:hypothetical protein [Pyrinomonadaceae bacterium]